MRDQDCVDFLQWCLPKLGLRWAGFRKVRGTVCKRLRRRLRALDLNDLDEYRARLETDAREWQQLDALCRIPISRFYRDKALFAALAARLMPRLAADCADARRSALRCWSAGCASGEEPYSLRLVWHMEVAPAFPGLTCSIVASDVDPVMLSRAQRACYGSSSLKDLPAEWISRAFSRSGGELCLRPAFRCGVAFVQQDIREAMPDGPFDLILCRNLAFIYFDAATQAEVFHGLDARLRSGGALAIGSHECLPKGATGYSPLAPGLPLFLKANARSAR